MPTQIASPSAPSDAVAAVVAGPSPAEALLATDPLVATSNAAPAPVIEAERQGRLPAFPGWRRPLRSFAWCVRALFGLASLVFLLAVIAAVPVLNFLALGYLLEVAGRVGRTGRLRDGFPLFGIAPRLGSIALGTYLCLLPLRLISTSAAAAHTIDPGAPADERMQGIRTVAGVLMAAHICLALARGGSLGCFFRPIKNVRWLWRRLREGEYLSTAGEHVHEFVQSLQLRRHFVLGLQGFFAAALWLVLPTVVYASVRNPGGAGALQILVGGSLLVLVLAWVPFLQTRLAVEQRWGAGFELREVRRLFRYAPWAWLLAVAVTCVLSLPLYLFKAFVLPQDALWPITLIYIASIYPTRLVTGWAYHRAVQRRADGRQSRWMTCAAVRLLGMLPLLAAYVFLLYFTQFLGAAGKLTLYEHHAFLLPWPYLLGNR